MWTSTHFLHTWALMVGGACSPLGAKSSYLNSGSSTRHNTVSGGTARTTAGRKKRSQSTRQMTQRKHFDSQIIEIVSALLLVQWKHETCATVIYKLPPSLVLVRLASTQLLKEICRVQKCLLRNFWRQLTTVSMFVPVGMLSLLCLSKRVTISSCVHSSSSCCCCCSSTILFIRTSTSITPSTI